MNARSPDSYIPLLPDPPIQGDSLTTPFMVGRVAFNNTEGLRVVDTHDLPHFVAKNDLSESRLRPANDLVHSEVAAPLKNAVPTSRNLYDKYVRFVPVAQAFASLSKMSQPAVGCVILGDAFQVLSSGWNGAARGCKADTDERLATRTSRLNWVVHAEANAIVNAARSGVKLEGGVLIVTMMPCMSCAKLIVQAGIKLVLCPIGADPRWFAEFDLACALFDECGVGLFHYATNKIKE